MGRPDGHSFEAIRILQEGFNKEDMYSIYQYNDGQDECLPFVIKISTRKVELLCRLNKNEGDRLSSECVFLDVLHSRCKSWKTYTLSYYDSILKELVKLVTMETVTENAEYCELFLELINEIICKFNNNKESSKINPVHMKYNKHSGNQIAIKNVFGVKFYQERTSSCEYHFNKSVEKHKKFLRNEDISTYKKTVQT